MTAPQQWRLERKVYNDYAEKGWDAARKRKTNSDPSLKAFIETVPQVADPILNLERFEAFLDGWNTQLRLDRGSPQTYRDGKD